MEIGALVYQQDADRMDIRFSPNRYYGGLHCGEIVPINTDHNACDCHEDVPNYQQNRK